MRYFLLFMAAITLSANTAFATSIKWQKINQNNDLGKVFQLVATEANKRNISDIDYVSLAQANEKDSILYKFEISTQKVGVGIDDQNVNIPRGCDLVLIKLTGNTPQLLNWEEKTCNKDKTQD